MSYLLLFALIPDLLGQLVAALLSILGTFTGAPPA